MRKDLRSGGIRLAQPGAYVVVLETDNRAYSHQSAMRFNDYLEAEGLTPALEHRTRTHRMHVDGFERYSRAAKSIVPSDRATVRRPRLAAAAVRSAPGNRSRGQSLRGASADAVSGARAVRRQSAARRAGQTHESRSATSASTDAAAHRRRRRRNLRDAAGRQLADECRLDEPLTNAHATQTTRRRSRVSVRCAALDRPRAAQAAGRSPAESRVRRTSPCAEAVGDATDSSSLLISNQRLAPIVSNSACSCSITCRIAAAGGSVRTELSCARLQFSGGQHCLQTQLRVALPSVLLGVQQRRLRVVENSQSRCSLDHRHRRVRKIDCHRNRR